MSEIFPRDVAIRFGPKMLERYQSLVVLGAGRGRVRPLPYTFTRADGGTPIATAVSSSGVIQKVAQNTPRIEYVDLNADGVRETAIVLFDGSRINRWTKSRIITDGVWTKVNLTGTADAIIGPFGTVTMDQFTEDAINAHHYIERTLAGCTDNQPQSFLITLRPKNGRQWIRLVTLDKSNTSRTSWVDMTNGVAGTTNAGHQILKVEKLANSSVRIWFVITSIASGATTPLIEIASSLADNNNATFVGDGVTGFYAEGWQFERDAAFPSSFIETDAAEVTRQPDLLTVPIGIHPFAEGLSVYMDLARPVHADATGTVGTNGIFDLGNAAADHVWSYFESTTRALTFAVAGGAAGVGPAGSPLAIPAGVRLQLLQQVKEFATGPKVAADTGAGMTAFGSASANPLTAYGQQVLRIGDIINAGDGLFGGIADLEFYRGLNTRAEAIAAAA